MSTEFMAIFSTQQRDIAGETLDIAGADISELEAGRGYVNDGHSQKLADQLGRITYAKKIMKLEDCADDDERTMWNKVKCPLIFGKGILFDDQDHRSAKAAAAIIRHQHAQDSPLKLKASVEGGVLERGSADERHLKRTKIKGLALTFAPCNNATLVLGLNLRKSAMTYSDLTLIKSCIPLIRTDVPSFIEVADAISESKIADKIVKIHKLVKALTAGYGSAGAPSNLTGGGVIQAEALDDGGHKDKTHITCDDDSCGKAQYYMPHQIKCRHCGKSLKFDNLVKYFLNYKS